jgi:hypothetical protein
MRLDSFIVAESAHISAEGRMGLLGGGITRIIGDSVPFATSLSVILRFQVDEQDRARDHRVVVSIIGPDGSEILPAADFDMPSGEVFSRPISPGEERQIQVMVGAPMIVFSEFGIHRIRVEADGEVVRDMPLPIWPTAAGPE